MSRRTRAQILDEITSLQDELSVVDNRERQLRSINDVVKDCLQSVAAELVLGHTNVEVAEVTHGANDFSTSRHRYQNQGSNMQVKAVVWSKVFGNVEVTFKEAGRIKW